MTKWYQDDSFVEHGCCWDHAIVRRVPKGDGQYGGDVELVAEVFEQEHVDLILKAVNELQNDE